MAIRSIPFKPHPMREIQRLLKSVADRDGFFMVCCDYLIGRCDNARTASGGGLELRLLARSYFKSEPAWYPVGDCASFRRFDGRMIAAIIDGKPSINPGLSSPGNTKS